ncbi:MAG: hypothetical protein IPP11_00625 [Chitinophagaceae bacterium]|nr:hypothetical protein [Chitinophagaceae bacterium]
MKFRNTLFILLLPFWYSCATSHYSPAKKYPAAALKEDYRLLRNILEAKHPSLYWYTSKDSMDYYFDFYERVIPDSMNEPMFAWHILAPLTQKIHCGHTSVSLSNSYANWVKNRQLPSFPLYIKAWKDTLVVLGSLTRNDSIFKRGTLITSINGIRNRYIIERMFNFLPEDGYASNINYLRISSNFPYFHRNIFGLSRQYSITYLDSLHTEKQVTIAAWEPPKPDSTKKKMSKTKIKKLKLPKEKRENRFRSFTIDSTANLAVMNINSFTKGHLRKFYRRSFKKLKQENITNLIVDIRSNGGGRVGLSTLLTRYVSRKPFKVADSLYSVAKSMAPYTNHIKNGLLTNIELFFITKKYKDGYFHLGHLERKAFKPKTKKNFKGKVYILTNGPTFSASALFCNAMKGQPGVTLVGEETGGGWYGNNGIIIPDIVLPNTKIRVRLPLFRLLQFEHDKVPQKGTGVIPDIYCGPSLDALIHKVDNKMEAVIKMIRSENPQQ